MHFIFFLVFYPKEIPGKQKYHTREAFIERKRVVVEFDGEGLLRMMARNGTVQEKMQSLEHNSCSLT